MYKRIVVKVGTKAISVEDGSLDLKTLAHLVGQIASLRKRNIEVVLVTSGAVGAGRGLLSLNKGQLGEKQVLASVGQVRLMSLYSELFEKHGYICAQVLVTKEDFRDRIHYRNMKSCFEALLFDRVIPIVNENDVVATTELLFTDNDELAGLVAGQLNADAVVILTSVEGVLAEGKVVPEIDFLNIASFQKYVTPERSTFGRGGMITKFGVAKKLASQGIVTHIASGKRKSVLLGIVEGKTIGTKFVPQRKSSAIKRRLAYSEGLSKGVVYVNKCTEDILRSKTKIISLLPIGITQVAGKFAKGDIVEIKTEKKETVGFGVAQYNSEKAEEVKGKKNVKPFIHYNYMFIGG